MVVKKSIFSPHIPMFYLTDILDDRTSLVICTVIFTIVCIVLGSTLISKTGSTDQHEGSKSLIKSKSLCDISEGLRKEELRTTSSFNSLANLADDERVLSAAAFREFKVLKVTKVSHNTKLIRFEIPHGKPLGLSIGRHITVRARIGESEGEGNSSKVMRAYTPTSRPDQKGYFDLLVKSYEFGKLSPHLHTLRAGSSVEVRGPVGRFRYTPNRFPHPLSMGLIAGGTGLTPCLQVIRCVLEGQTEDSTCFTLLFQNRTEDDILLKEELDGLVERHPQRLRVIYFLSNPTSTDFGNKAQMMRNAQDGYGAEVRGYINADAVRDILRPERCPFVGLCGPSGFNATMKHLLMSVGHVDESKDGEKVTGQDPTIYIW